MVGGLLWFESRSFSLVDCRRLEVRFRWLVIRLWFIESRSFPLVYFHRLKVVHFRCLVGR